MTRTTKSPSTKEQSEKCDVLKNITTTKKSPKKTEPKQSRARVIRKKTEEPVEHESPEIALATDNANHPNEPVDHNTAIQSQDDEPVDDVENDEPIECSEPDDKKEDNSDESLDEDDHMDTINGKPSVNEVNRNNSSRPNEQTSHERDKRIGKVYKMDNQPTQRYNSSNNQHHNRPYNNRENVRENVREHRKPRHEYANNDRGENKNSCLKFSYRDVVQKLENERCGDLTIEDHLRFLIAHTHQEGKLILNNVFKQTYQAMNHEASYPLTDQQIRGVARHQKTEYGGSRNQRDGQYGGRGQASHRSRVPDM